MSYKLRQSLISKYGRCILTGYCNPWEYEVAHIVPKYIAKKINYPNYNKESNCILLSHGLHRLFDKMVWSLDTTRVKEDNLLSCLPLVVKSNYNTQNSILALYKERLVYVPTICLSSLDLHYKVFNDTDTQDLIYSYAKFIK
jgi:hypothetical protein